MQEDGRLSAFSLIRYTVAPTTINLKLRSNRTSNLWSQFSIHSVTAFRLSVSHYQVEHLAGFCHFRGCLKQYRIDQVVEIEAPATREPINDLVAWIDARVPGDRNEDTPVEQLIANQALEYSIVVQRRHCTTMTRAIDRAISYANRYGMNEVALCLNEIRGDIPANSSKAG